MDAVIYMPAKETEDDWTEACGTQQSTIYQADPGWQITNIVGPIESSYSYRDNDHERINSQVRALFKRIHSWVMAKEMMSGAIQM